MTNNSKQLQILASPLQRIADASEASANTLFQIHQVVVSVNTYALETVQELKKQTGVLLDIKSILKEQNKSIERGAGAKGGAAGGQFTPMSAKDVGLTALMIIGVAGAIVGAAAIFSLVPVISVPQLLTVLAVAGVLMLVTPAYIRISEAITKSAATMAGGDSKNINPSSPKTLFAAGGAPLVAIVGMAASLVIAGAIFTLMPLVNPFQLLTALAVAVILIPAAFAYSLILKASRGLKTEHLIFASIALPLMALGIVGAALAFMLLPTGGELKAPDPLWVLKSAFAIGLYAVGFYFIMKAIKGASIKELIYGTIAIPLMALGILAVAGIFAIFPQIDPSMAPDPIWVLKSAFAIGLYAVGFYFIMKAIKGASIKELIFGAIAIPVLALGIVATAYIFGLLGDVSAWAAPDPMWTLKAGFALLVFAVPFYLVSKAIKGLGLKELLFMVAAIPVVAFAVLATAWIFQALDGISYNAPEPDWTLKAGLSIVIFGLIVFLSSKTVGQLGMGDMLKALVGVVVAAFATVAVAWIFQLLPGNFLSPPMDWTMNVALALGVMGAAMVVMGIAVTALTPVTLLLGALGIIVAAVVILAVGWILAGLAPVMPKLVTVAQGFTDVLLAPVNGMIDVFARFKNEIGVENMIDLAIGIAALGGAWLIFSAALGGASIASGIGNAIGGLFDGIGKLFGSDTPSPIELLERIAAIAPKIQNLAKPLYAVGKGFSMINHSAGGVMKAFQALVNFHDEVDSSEFALQAKSTEMIANSYKKISDSSRTMNIKAIYATTNMFKALDDLAKNGGQSAMGVLADKLMEAVKQLTGTVVNLEKSVEKQGNATSGIGDALSGAIDSVKETVTGVKKNVDAMNKDTKGALDLEPLIKAINDLEARFDSAIRVIDVTDN